MKIIAYTLSILIIAFFTSLIPSMGVVIMLYILSLQNFVVPAIMLIYSFSILVSLYIDGDEVWKRISDFDDNDETVG